jgi:predicted peptidase
MYEKKTLVQHGDTMYYRIMLPKNYDSMKIYPVVFFLHGAGERGNDNQKQLVHGGKLFTSDSARDYYQSIVIFPQCSNKDYWSNVLRLQGDNQKRSFYFLEDGQPSRSMELLQELVKYVLHEYPVKKEQVYVGGLSMGGMGAYELVRRMPNTFAAAIAICGGANPATAKQLKKTNWWIFHGGKDDVVLPVFSEQMYKALKAKNAKVKFTLYPTANHNSWDRTFAEPGLLAWLFSQKK